MYKKEDLIITNYKRVPVHRFIANTSPFSRHAYTADTKYNSHYNNIKTAQTVRQTHTVRKMGFRELILECA